MARVTSNTLISDLVDRVTRMETRLDEHIAKSSDYRESMQIQVGEIKKNISLGEHSHNVISEKLDKVSNSVNDLVKNSIKKSGSEELLVKIADPIFKVLIAVGVAYIIFYLKIK
jgi:hypothetical protein